MIYLLVAFYDGAGQDGPLAGFRLAALSKDKILKNDDMFSILQQVKIAMSNKNDPYNYADTYQQQTKKNLEV